MLAHVVDENIALVGAILDNLDACDKIACVSVAAIRLGTRRC